MKYVIIHTGYPKEADMVEAAIRLEHGDAHGRIFGLEGLYEGSVLKDVDGADLVVILHPGEPEMFLAGWVEASMEKHKKGNMIIVLSRKPWFSFPSRYTTVVTSARNAIVYIQGCGEA